MKNNFQKHLKWIWLMLCMIFLMGCGMDKEGNKKASSSLMAETTIKPTVKSMKEFTKEPVLTPQPTIEPTKNPDYEYKFTVVNETVYVKEKVRVRTEADTKNKKNIYKKLSRGTPLKRVGYQEKWSKVELDGSVYYIASQYLSTKKIVSKVVVIDAGHQELVKKKQRFLLELLEWQRDLQNMS